MSHVPCVLPGEVPLFLDEALPEPRQADLNRHLEQCSVCQRQVIEEADRFGRELGLHGGAPSVPNTTTASALPGAPRVPGCRLLRQLGRGGGGTVYLAFQYSLKRQVAVKVIEDP